METSGSNRPVLAGCILGLCLVAVVLGMVRVGQGASANGSHSRPGAPHNVLSADKLAYLSLDGMIIETPEQSSVFKSESNAVQVRRLLYAAAKDSAVKGVLLRIDSPGGTVGMSQELYHAVLAVRRVKPVVVSMGDLAASGGYYTASAADQIVANPGTLTASIGVILHSMNLEGLLSGKLGVKAVTVKSGQYKDILSPYRPMTPSEHKMLQSLIDTSYHQFLHAVLYGRTLAMTDPALKAQRIRQITAIADGRVVIGEDALKIGLVDKLGGLEEAKQLLKHLAAKRFNLRHAERLTLATYDTEDNLWQLIGLQPEPVGQINWGNLFGNARSLDMLPGALRLANQPLWLMETGN